MKILYLIDHDIDGIGGSQKSTKTIINEMIKSNHEVALFMETDSISNYEGFFINDSCRVYRIKERHKKNRLLYFFKKIKMIKTIINEYNPTIIHAQNPSSGIIVGFMKKHMLLPKNIKCIYTDRAMYKDYSLPLRIMFRSVSYYWDCLITTTHLNQKQWESNTKLKQTNCINNVLDENWFEYKTDIETRLKENNKVNDKLVIGFSGRYVAYKKWDTVLKICQELKDENRICFSFAIASASEEKQIKELGTEDEYIEKIKRIRPDSLIYLNANVDQIIDFNYLMDIFVLTSSAESFGRTLIEAMTKKCVVLGTNVGGVPEVIGNSNFIYEVDDYMFVVNKIKEYLNNFDKLRRDKMYFYEFVNKTYTPDILSKKHNELYERMIKE